MSPGLIVAGALAGAAALVALPSAVLSLVAAARRRRFLPALGPVVRIATPCRVVHGRALFPGTVGLTPEGLVWDAPFGLSGRVPFERIRRLETDQRLGTGRRLLRSEVLRVTRVDGGVEELVLGRGAAHEWHRAIGEWVGRQGAVG